MNPHAIIVGHTGSGKSVLIKATEIFQTLISTSDDILILDPQNEFKEIVEKYGGSYFDLTPKSKIYINGFEVSDAVFLSGQRYKRKIYRYTDKVCKEPCGSYHDKYPVYTGTCYRSQPCNKKDV